MSAAIGETYGSLLIMDEAGKRGGLRMVKCRCECGKVKVLYARNIESGRSKSCGCKHQDAHLKYPPMGKNRSHMTEEQKRHAQENYRLGHLPKWMFD